MSDDFDEYVDPFGLLEMWTDQVDLAEQSLGDPEPPTGIDRNTVWVTKDGQKVSIKNMTDIHLLRTIRVLLGESPIETTFRATAERRKQFIQVMCNEAHRRRLSLEGWT